MKKTLGVLALLALTGTVGCAGIDQMNGEADDQADDTQLGSDESALTLSTTTPLQVSSDLPPLREFDELRDGFRFVRRGCAFLAVITYSGGPGQFTTSGVCTETRTVLWRVHGSIRADWAALSRTIADQTAEVRRILDNMATQTGAIVDFGVGGGGDFGKIGPLGGGPVGPGPGGPGGHDPVLAYLLDEADKVHAAFTPVTGGLAHLPGANGVLTP